ncbi:MAG: malectin, partial [Acidobacteriota bacterium]|nr:malectin [Acidobacteriota bacterium]
QQLYRSARYRYTDENFSYKFAAPNGRYAVTLKFADYTFKEPGHYDFDVLLNGAKVLKNFDFDIVYGPRTAVDKRFETNVTNKSLTIDFIGHKGGASVNGLEIVYLGEPTVSP